MTEHFVANQIEIGNSEKEKKEMFLIRIMQKSFDYRAEQHINYAKSLTYSER